MITIFVTHNFLANLINQLIMIKKTKKLKKTTDNIPKTTKRTKGKKKSTNEPIVPPGFVAIETENQAPIVVPQFLVPATNVAFDACKRRRDLNIDLEDGGVSIVTFHCRLPC